LNIGLFTDTYFPQINGVGTSVHTLAQELMSKGHNVYIFTPSDPRRTDYGSENIIEMKSMPCFIIKSFRIGLLYSPQELLKIKNLHLDIIHTQTEFSQGIFGKIMAKTLGIPMVHTYHTMYEDYVHYLAGGLIVTPAMSHTFSKVFCNSADCVIAPTKKVCDSLLSYGVRKKISIIPTGIQLDRFLNDSCGAEEISSIKEGFGLSDNNPTILILGRIAEEKSIDKIIEVCPKVFDEIPEARLLIVGDGPYKKNIEEKVQDAGISEKTVFAGAKPWSEIVRYYRMGDVLVSASVSETQGLTFVEAMSAKTLVLAKNDKCVSGLVEDGKTGFLFDSKEELEDKLIYILKNRNNFESIKQAALNAATGYSSHEFGTKVEALYNSVLLSPQEYGIEKRIGFDGKQTSESELYQNIRKLKVSTDNFKALAVKPAKAVVRLVYKNNNNNKGGN